MGDQSAGGGPGALLQSLFYMTPVGARYAGAMSAVEGVRYRRALDEWRKGHEERLAAETERTRARQEARDTELAGLGRFYQNPELALSETPGFKFPETWEKFRPLREEARTARLEKALGGALADVPGEPAQLEAQTTETGGTVTGPNLGLLQMAGPTREVESPLVQVPARTDPWDFTAISGEASTRVPGGRTVVPGTAGPLHPRREPILTGPVQAPEFTATTEVAETVPGSVQYTPPTSPRRPTMGEALGRVPEEQRGAVARFLAQHPTTVRPPRSPEERASEVEARRVRTAHERAMAKFPDVSSLEYQREFVTQLRALGSGRDMAVKPPADAAGEQATYQNMAQGIQEFMQDVAPADRAMFGGAAKRATDLAAMAASNPTRYGKAANDAFSQLQQRIIARNQHLANLGQAAERNRLYGQDITNRAEDRRERREKDQAIFKELLANRRWQEAKAQLDEIQQAYDEAKKAYDKSTFSPKSPEGGAAAAELKIAKQWLDSARSAFLKARKTAGAAGTEEMPRSEEGNVRGQVEQGGGAGARGTVTTKSGKTVEVLE